MTDQKEKAEPIGWVFQHGDTGLMCFCENDGINNADNFAMNNPRHVLCGPAYTHPAPAQEEASPSDALNLLEQWVGNGGLLHGDDVHRFRALVEMLTPAELVGQADTTCQLASAMQVIEDWTSNGFTLHPDDAKTIRAMADRITPPVA